MSVYDDRDQVVVSELAIALNVTMDEVERLLDEAESMRVYVMCPACGQPVSEHTNDQLAELTNGVVECQITIQEAKS